MAEKTFNNVKLNITFTKAADHLSNIESGNLANQLSKIAKWYDDFHEVVWSGDATTVNGHTVASNVPANAKFTDTTYEIMTGASASASGASGLVPVPTAGQQGLFLRGDGTWASPEVPEYSAAGTNLGLVKTGGSVTISEGVITVNDDSHNHVIDNVDGLQTALDNKLETSLKGAANGLAELDADGKVPSAQLPSYVDDVIEGYMSDGKLYEEADHTTQITGESGKIYVDLDTSKTYRWSGSTFVEISASLALGETSTTAYRGDRGKIAYDHSQLTSGNPHNVTKEDLGLGNVENKSSADIRSELTKENVTTALGYTPPEQDTTYGLATSTKEGLMSAAHYTKLEGISAGAEVNQNAFSNVVAGSTTITADEKEDTLTIKGGDNVTVSANGSEITISAIDTIYSNASASAAGLMSSAHYTKLEGIEAGANKYVLPAATTDTLGGIIVGNNLTVSADGTLSATDTTYSVMTGATSSAAGKSGLVPVPTAGQQNYFLMGDGTWSNKPVVEEDTLILNCVAD